MTLRPRPVADGTGRDGTGRDGTGRDGTGRDAVTAARPCVAVIEADVDLPVRRAVDVRCEPIVWFATGDRIDPGLIVLCLRAAERLAPTAVAARIAGAPTRVVLCANALSGDAAKLWTMQTVAPFVFPHELAAEFDAVARAPCGRPLAALDSVREILARHLDALRPELRQEPHGAGTCAAAELSPLHHLDTLSVEAWARSLAVSAKTLERRCAKSWSVTPRTVLDLYRIEVFASLTAAGIDRGRAAEVAGYGQLRSVHEAVARLATFRTRRA